MAVSVVLSGAHVQDQTQVLQVLDQVRIPVRRGRPKKRPKKVELDKGYDSKKLRWEIRQRHIQPRISRRRWKGKTYQRQVPDQQWGPKKRWTVERLFGWWDAYRRLLVRWERRAEIHLGFILLACIHQAFRKLFLK